MSADETKKPEDGSQELLEQLQSTGFFDQIGELEKSLKSIADDLKIVGDATIKRIEETESLVAHVLAIESILAVLLKNSTARMSRRNWP